MTQSFLRKIVERDRLLAEVGLARRGGRTIVQCHGCFDIVHPGHIRYLEFARRQGDVLIVTLTPDADIAKGAQKPYMPQELRAENLAALEFVDWVCVDDAPTAEEILRAVRPDVYVKGREYESSRDAGFLAERAIVEAQGGRVIFSSGEVVFSSTRLIDALPGDAALEAERLRILCRRHDIDGAGLSALVERFSGLRVVVVGDIILDRYVFCDALDVASESPMLSLNRLSEERYVGGAAIVARHAAALGASAVLVGAIGPDDGSTYAEKVLGDEGVETRLLSTRDALVEKTRFLVDDQKVLKVASGKVEPLDSEAERRCADELSTLADESDAIIFCDFGYGAITGGLLARVLPELRRKVRVLTADVSGGHANLLHFREADLLCPSEREVRETLHDFEHGLSSVAWELLERTQARRLCVTLNKKGLVVFDRRTQDQSSPDWSARLRSEHLPSFGERVVDRLGCGDALLAAATLTLASGGSLMQAAYVGSAAAAIELSHLGNIPVDATDLSRWLHRRPELRPEADPVLAYGLEL